MTTTPSQKLIELAAKNIQIGYVRFNPEKVVYIHKLSDVVNFKIRRILENHPSVITTDWDSNLSTIRVFTKQLKNEWYYFGHSDYIKFISKYVSNENILKYKVSQFLVTDPAYKIKRDWVSVVDDGKGQTLVDYFETNYETIIELLNSNPVDSVRLFEFLEKMN